MYVDNYHKVVTIKGLKLSTLCQFLIFIPDMLLIDTIKTFKSHPDFNKVEIFGKIFSHFRLNRVVITGFLRLTKKNGGF